MMHEIQERLIKIMTKKWKFSSVKSRGFGKRHLAILDGFVNRLETFLMIQTKSISILENC